MSPITHPRATLGLTVRDLVADERFAEAWRLLVPELLGADAGAPSSIARNLLRAGAAADWSPPTTREIRLAVLCTYEAAELREYLRLACLALRIDAKLYVAPYGQVEQELLGGGGPLAAFHPTHVLLAPTSEDLGFPELADDPEPLLTEGVGRWVALWEVIGRDLGARVVQHGFVVPDDTALGHLSLRLPGSRISMVRECNRRIALAAAPHVMLVDTERLAASLGKRRWLDPRLWYSARQPFGLDALSVLARETAAVLAADLGLAARCIVVDLDNTLWGGIVGEDGACGIAVGHGPDGEAYAAFQDYLGALARRGMILGVASKNDQEAAREPFKINPAMRLSVEDFAAFVADWRPKSEQLTEIAQTLGIGLDTIVFADDNPAECAEVAAALPEVTVIALDVPPSERVRRLASSVRFEMAALSRDDLARQRSYAGRAQATRLRDGAASLEDFWRSLEMHARVAALSADALDRAAQLTQKTNQFNLTLRRHDRGEIGRLAAQDRAVCLTLELEDRFAAHGLIGLGFLVADEIDRATAVIDTLLLSCRVIGRTAEVHLLSHLGRAALSLGYSRLQGIYVPGPRNGLVADLYPRLGFTRTDDAENRWDYDLEANGPLSTPYIADLP